MLRKLLVGVVVAVVLAVVAGPASAEWFFPMQEGPWNDANTWNVGRVPDIAGVDNEGDNVLIKNFPVTFSEGDDYYVRLVEMGHANSGAPGDGAGQLTMTGGQLKTRNDFVVGSSDGAVFDQSGGDVISESGMAMGLWYGKGDLQQWNLSGGSVASALDLIIGAGNQANASAVEAELNQSGNSSVDVLGNVILGLSSAGSTMGTYNMDAGMLTVGGTILVGDAPGPNTFNFGGGVITLAGDQTGFNDANDWFNVTGPAGLYTETFDGVGQTTLQYIPEPSTLVLLLAGGMAGLLLWRRKR